MTVRGRIKLCVTAAGAFLFSQSSPKGAQAVSATTKEAAHDSALQRDGQHDFDFLIGSWKIHLKRLVHPLSGAAEWVELDGTTVCRTLFDGRAEVEEMNVDSADKHMHIQGLALRLYNPTSHQWSIWWANAKDGAMNPPPVVGEFENGRGEFYDQDVFNGRAVFTRFVWSGVTTNSPHFEQSMSADGGKTWELWWITDQTKDRR
jgi:hypothetical protein